MEGETAIMPKTFVPDNVLFTNRIYGKGEVIIVEGDTDSESLYYILTGSVEIRRNCGKVNEVLLATLNSGDFFGELSLFLKEPRTATVTAREYSTIMEVRKCNMHDFIDENPADAYSMMETLCVRFNNMLKQQDLMVNILQSLVSTKSVGDRVRSTLKMVACSMSLHKILIATVDKDAGTINVRYSYLDDEVHESFLRPALPFGPGEFLYDLLEEVKPEPFICQNLSETLYAEIFESLGEKAAILVPVIVDDEMWGCMAAYDCFDVRDFSDNDVRFVQLLTSALTKLVMEDDLRKEKEEAEEKSSLLLRALPEACILLDDKFNMIDCNVAALELFLLSKETEPQMYPKVVQEEWILKCTHDYMNCEKIGNEDCCGRKCFMQHYRYIFPEYYIDKTSVEEIITEHSQKASAATTGDKMHRFEYVFVTMYGKPVTCQVSVVPVDIRGRMGYACYLRDIKEEKMRIAAEEENRAKTRFLARMSHEIRTPMNAVLGITEMELRKPHPQETKEAFMRIHKSSGLQLSIINDILDIAKVEAGKMEIIPVSYDMSGFIMDSVQLNLIYRNSDRVEFRLYVDERLPVSLIGDELRIKQIVNNLMSNAFKYTQEGLVTIRFSADYTAVHELILLIEIEDTGRGMTQEQVNRLFNEDFIRFDEQANHKIEGAGLGMSIVCHMVNMMGGGAEVKSFPGKGSLFSVWIPQKADSEYTLGKETANNLEQLNFDKLEANPVAEMTLTPMPYGRVLVVDDMEINLYVAQEMLKAYEINAEIIESGEEAVSQIEAGAVYDIIFMDHMMPGMDGIEAAKRIRDTGYPHPIVALTANAVEGMAELFESSGFSGFISKPIDLNQLDGYLLKFIRNKHMQKYE